MLNAIIVDDEVNSQLVLRELIGQFVEGVTVTGEAGSVEQAYAMVEALSPQLVFLDVQMPTGNGFELLHKYDILPFDVIFVTSYDQYAINAIKFSALDYLLKPVDIEGLKQAVSKARRSNKLKQSSQGQIVNLLQSVDPEVIEKKIALHHNDLVKLVKVSSILYIESDVNYTHIHTLEGDVFTSSRTMKEFEEYLSVQGFFVRIHRETLINTHHVRHYSKGDPFIIEMSNGKTFEASRRRKTEVLERLKR